MLAKSLRRVSMGEVTENASMRVLVLSPLCRNDFPYLLFTWLQEDSVHYTNHLLLVIRPKEGRCGVGSGAVGGFPVCFNG